MCPKCTKKRKILVQSSANQLDILLQLYDWLEYGWDNMHQGIININRNENSVNFFSYVCNSKKIKELFASTLNGIPASVRCVSSMIVVLNDKFADYLRCRRTKKTVRNEKARQECRVLLVKTR